MSDSELGTLSDTSGQSKNTLSDKEKIERHIDEIFSKRSKYNKELRKKVLEKYPEYFQKEITNSEETYYALQEMASKITKEQVEELWEAYYSKREVDDLKVEESCMEDEKQRLLDTQRRIAELVAKAYREIDKHLEDPLEEHHVYKDIDNSRRTFEALVKIKDTMTDEQKKLLWEAYISNREGDGLE